VAREYCVHLVLLLNGRPRDKFGRTKRWLWPATEATTLAKNVKVKSGDLSFGRAMSLAKDEAGKTRFQ
jgi:hypothetical protein